MVFLCWRSLCRLFTAARHPTIAGRSSVLLRYETPAQKAAYASTCLNPPLDASRRRHVLAIMPFRDKWAMTRIGLESLARLQLAGIELLVAMSDNGSVEHETLAGLAAMKATNRSGLAFRHLRQDIPFNFSRLNNQALAACADFAPEYLLFINNDVELTDPHTIAAMCAFLEANPACGSVGCTLLYPDHRIQHLFVFVGCKIVGAHPFKGHSHNPSDPWMQSPRPVCASTAALLFVRTRDFLAVGAFDETLPSFQDVDLALKLQQRGMVNWVLPAITAIHRETQSRSHAFDWAEVATIHARWGRQLTENPYASGRLCRWSEQIALSLGEGAYPWQKLASPPQGDCGTKLHG